MNLLLHDDPDVCERFLDLLGVAAGLATVDDDGGFTLFANNELTRSFYQINRFPHPLKLDAGQVGHLLYGDRDPEQVRVYIERMKANYRACVDAGQPLHTETEMQGPDGVRWGRNTLSPVFSGSRVARILVTFIDVTEIHEAREQLEQSLTSLVAGMVTVCESCHRIHDDNDWITMAEYMRRHSDRQFTHGICDKCLDGLAREH